jgi:hypothetical protein
LLKALRAYTGYHITLIGGRLLGDKVDLVSVHAGTTKTKDGTDNGKDFTEWNQEGYLSQVLAQFVRYLAAASKYFRTSFSFDEELTSNVLQMLNLPRTSRCPFQMRTQKAHPPLPSLPLIQRSRTKTMRCRCSSYPPTPHYLRRHRRAMRLLQLQARSRSEWRC